MKIVPIWFILFATEGSDLWSVWNMYGSLKEVTIQLKLCRKLFPQLQWIKHKVTRIP